MISVILSHNGIEIQVYFAMIACLQMNLLGWWQAEQTDFRNDQLLLHAGLPSEEERVGRLEKIRRQSEDSAAKNK